MMITSFLDPSPLEGCTDQELTIEKKRIGNVWQPFDSSYPSILFKLKEFFLLLRLITTKGAASMIRLTIPKSQFVIPLSVFWTLVK